MTTLSAFVQAVDEEPDKDDVEAVLDFFASKGITKQQGLVAVEIGDLGDLPTKPTVAGLARRAILAATLAYKARVSLAGGPSQSSGPSSSQGSPAAAVMSQQLALAGHDLSAKTLAETIAPTVGSVSPVEALKLIKVELPHKMVAEAAVFNLLEAERRVAAKENRKPFLYLDFTSKELLPPWVTADAVGGQSLLPGELASISPEEPTGNIAALSHALRSASTSPRFFRSFSQWLGSWTRYVPFAVASTHMEWVHVVAYQSTMAKLAEDQRVKYGHSYLAFLYDDIQRRSLAKRIQSGEVVDLLKELSSVNEDSMEIAKSRLAATLAHIGIHLKGEEPRSAASGHGLGAQAAESALAKQVAAAEALSAKAQKAVKDMARQQDVIDQRAGWDPGWQEKGGKGKDRGKRGEPPPTQGAQGEVSNRKRKSMEWIKSMRSKGGKRGGGKGYG